MAKKYIEACDLQQYLMDCLQIAVDKSAERACLFLTQYIMEHWYAEYSPRVYKRTFDFVRSVSKTDATFKGKNGNTVSCFIFFDTSKIRSVYYGPEYLNPHTSFEGKDVSDKIPKWIEHGGWFHGRGKTEGLGSMEATIKMLEKDFPTMVSQELKKLGLDIKIVGK